LVGGRDAFGGSIDSTPVRNGRMLMPLLDGFVGKSDLRLAEHAAPVKW
jgi:hypothetical protein